MPAPRKMYDSNIFFSIIHVLTPTAMHDSRNVFHSQQHSVQPMSCRQLLPTGHYVPRQITNLPGARCHPLSGRHVVVRVGHGSGGVHGSSMHGGFVLRWFRDHDTMSGRYVWQYDGPVVGRVFRSMPSGPILRSWRHCRHAVPRGLLLPPGFVGANLLP